MHALVPIHSWPPQWKPFLSVGCSYELYRRIIYFYLGTALLNMGGQLFPSSMKWDLLQAFEPLKTGEESPIFSKKCQWSILGI